MTRYERQVLAVDDSGRVDVDGRIVSVLESPQAGRNVITALVEVAESADSETPAPATFSDDSEGVSDPTCAGKDGQCSRTVSEPGEKCWQHEDDDE